jgi:hypothetical protein
MKQLKTDVTLIEYHGQLPQLHALLADTLKSQLTGLPPPKSTRWRSPQTVQHIRMLLDALNRIAPRGYVFGPHPSAPECYGYWCKNNELPESDEQQHRGTGT